jgi:predicted esterase
MRAPLIIAQGANDPRVKRAESDQIYNALRGKGLEVQYFLYEGGRAFRLASYSIQTAFARLVTS